MKGLIVTIVIALITYVLGLHSSRKQSLREARLKTYANLIAFTSTYKITSQQIIERSYLDNLIALIAPARLLASDKTEDKMRDYFDESNRICKSVAQGESTDGGEKLVQLTLEMEESMRVDLGVRFYPRKLTVISS